MAHPTTTINALLHALATPLTVLMSASDILHNRAPDAIESPLQLLYELSHQFGREVVALRASPGESIDLHSSAKAVEQIRQLAAGWRGYEARLSELVDEVERAGVQMQEPLLNRILHQNLPNGLSELRQVLSRLEAIQPEDLTLS